MKIKIDIKSIFGDVLFSFEKDDNTIKDTLVEAYSLLIDKIYPNLLWENPYAFIYEFKLVK